MRSFSLDGEAFFVFGRFT